MTRIHGAIPAVLGISLLGLTPAPPPAAKSGALTPKIVDEIVVPIMEKAKIPGLSIAVSQDGDKTIERAYGVANLEHRIPVTSDSVFEIGSLTKTFTALCILMLQEDGRLNVEDRLSKYFPRFRGGDEITLRHLLQHTSGIKNITAVEPFCSEQSKDWRPQEIEKMLEDIPLDFEPGQQAEYSNSGCILLGLVIEKISGIAYGDFVTERIITPLGMTHTRMGTPGAIVQKRVSGYELNRVNGSVQNAAYVSVSAPYASGGILSTPSDLVKLKKAFRPGALLKKESIDAMFAPARLNGGRVFTQPDSGMTYGYCLEILTMGAVPVPAKTGGISGFNAFFAYLPERDFMLAVDSNLNDSLGALMEISRALLQRELSAR